MKSESVFIVHSYDQKEKTVIKEFFKKNKIKFEESPYDPAFVAKIKKSKKQALEGKIVRIELDEIWK